MNFIRDIQFISFRDLKQIVFFRAKPFRKQTAFRPLQEINLYVHSKTHDIGCFMEIPTNQLKEICLVEHSV